MAVYPFKSISLGLGAPEEMSNGIVIAYGFLELTVYVGKGGHINMQRNVKRGS